MFSYNKLMRKTNRVVNPGKLENESDEDYKYRCYKLTLKSKTFSANITNPKGWDDMIIKNVPTMESLMVDYMRDEKITPLPTHDHDREIDLSS